jgi:hypothetical protein
LFNLVAEYQKQIEEVFMSEMSRRSFLKTTAGVAAMGAAVPILSGGWQQLLGAEKPGYFEREFEAGISPTFISNTPSAIGSFWKTAKSTGLSAMWRLASASAPSKATRSAMASPRN